MNPLLLDIPTEFQTARLHIRVPQAGDGKKVYEAIAASISDLRPWLPFALEEPNEEDTEAGIRESYAKFITREDFRMHVFLRETGEFIGSSGLHNPNWRIPKFEIGYWIDSRFSGKGYMTEAVEGIVNFAFTELKANRLEIRCDTLNYQSIKIPRRLGFTLEGTHINEDLSVDGSSLRDTYVFAKVISHI